MFNAVGKGKQLFHPVDDFGLLAAGAFAAALLSVLVLLPVLVRRMADREWRK